ncbi:uncharacterized protein L3040_005375 [Drepanopeziza brunnea f. sp. 'multigermtubi']|uniref:Putative HET-s/LopB domain protein n=1 Tax=Marssonina brunnea f. sp. multigermtubi (strain MB_m1) TaxID=1072389 RepID=K1WXC5_MARBU|nr:putative HET-s/LopB domain protein [Drepanopeziza brunnea f. sp. 'multigermtubi' MB_m1]EKD17152.1 putative HET-s/LopB domain protein [Drepanopeziza brunnea f. sp. 'multigermtubi' MB_m1]KAJ5041809.1 hypothetical protein L3040_005375 [Drepanopeziza brunnea f. sp. 'multigermtubi']
MNSTQSGSIDCSINMPDSHQDFDGLIEAYQRANTAWWKFHFYQDYDFESASFVVQLRIVWFRFQAWSLVVGDMKHTWGDGLLPARLFKLITSRLHCIADLFEDAVQLEDSHIYITLRARRVRSRQVQAVMSRMTLAIRSIGFRLDVLEETGSEHMDYVLRSNSDYMDLLPALEGYIDELEALLTEAARRTNTSSWNEMTIALVGSLRRKDIDLVLEALGGGDSATSSSIRAIENLIQMKDAKLRHSRTLPIGKCWRLEEFDLPRDIQLQDRVLVAPKKDYEDIVGPGPFMLERRRYDRDSSPEGKEPLKARLDRLAFLLSSEILDAKSRNFIVLGYCNDPGSQSWWMVYRWPFFSSMEMKRLNPRKYPIISDLKSLFGMAEYEPPLEVRFKLAHLISKSLGELFNSGWTHQSFASDNILLPSYPDVRGPKFEASIFPSPYLVGLELCQSPGTSRDAQSAIYRHPECGGKSGSGWKMRYDIYSFGMVLYEIASWAPLLLNRQKRESFSANKRYWREEEVPELRHRVFATVENQMDFHMGSTFQKAVRWCLTMTDDENEEEWHCARDFQRHVVQPLERCAVFGEESRGITSRSRPLLIQRRVRELRGESEIESQVLTEDTRMEF